MGRILISNLTCFLRKGWFRRYFLWTKHSSRFGFIWIYCFNQSIVVIKLLISVSNSQFRRHAAIVMFFIGFEKTIIGPNPVWNLISLIKLSKDYLLSIYCSRRLYISFVSISLWHPFTVNIAYLSFGQGCLIALPELIGILSTAFVPHCVNLIENDTRYKFLYKLDITDN